MLRPDGSYVKLSEAGKSRAQPAFSAQQFLMDLAEGRTSVDAIPRGAFPSLAPLPPTTEEKAAEKISEEDEAAASMTPKPVVQGKRPRRRKLMQGDA